MTILESQSGLTALNERLSGFVVAPDGFGWDDARQAYNLTIDQQPAAVVFPDNVEDVQAIVDYAAGAGLQVAPQRTGHNAAPLGSLKNAILLKTDALDTVEIDAAGLTARVGAGVKWESVVPQVSDHGLAVLHGSTPDVSIAGYGLGGGLGWYARRHGLFTNSITAIELVTADGRLRRVDHENEPELFWALRGGGGNFGVVTALEFRLFPISEVYAGVLFFPWERSAEVLHAWHEWTETVPDEMTSVGRIMQFPPLEEIPAAAARQRLRARGGVLPRQRGGRGGAAGAAPGARTGDRHRRHGAAGSAERDAHGSAGPAALPRRPPRARRAAGLGDRRLRRCSGAGIGLHPHLGGDPAHGRRSRPKRGGTRSARHASPARSSRSPSAWCSTKPLRTRRTLISSECGARFTPTGPAAT